IRDGHVTGVQTCALPISPPRNGEGEKDTLLLPLSEAERGWGRGKATGRRVGKSRPFEVESSPASGAPDLSIPRGRRSRSMSLPRSEERRVGKECRCRGRP